jgi:apolipoprotein N-acyltransferase
MLGRAVAILQFLAPICAGALFTLGLSPFDVWIAVPLSAALLLILLHARSHERGWLTGWLYGLGLFGSGASFMFMAKHPCR